MAGRVREHDWASTTLGPIEDWPQCLKTVVDMMLSNGFAMTVLWGRDLIQIYNDAHRDLIADNHPGSLRPPHPRGLVGVLDAGRADHRTGLGGRDLDVLRCSSDGDPPGQARGGLVLVFVQPAPG